MRSTLMLRERLAPPRVAHAFFEGAAGASGGAPAADPPAGGQGAQDPPAGDGRGDPPAGDKGKPADPPEVVAMRRENARLAKELERLTKAEKERQDADLSEAERLKKEVADRDRLLEQERQAGRAFRLRSAAIAAAARLGFADPEDAFRFLDESAITWSDAGEPENTQELLKAVIEAKPYLKASGQQPPDLGQGGRGRTTLTREQIERMSPDEINKRWPEVQEVLARR